MSGAPDRGPQALPAVSPGKLSNLAIKDPEAVEAAFLPRPPALTVLECLGLSGVGLYAAAAFLAAASHLLARDPGILWSLGFWLSGGGGLLLLSGLFGPAALFMAALRLHSRLAGDPGAEDPLARPGMPTRLAGACYLVMLFDLVLALVVGAFTPILPILSDLGASLGAGGVLVLALAGHGLVVYRCTGAGSRAAAHLHALDAPPHTGTLVLGVPFLLMALMVSLQGGIHGDIRGALLVSVPLYLLGALSLSVGALAFTRPGTVTHEQLVAALRRPRPGLVEAVTASAWRAMLAVVLLLSLWGWVTSVVGRRLVLAFPQFPFLLLELSLVSLWTGWIGYHLWQLRPVGLLGKRYVAASLEDLRRPLLSGGVVCRYCGAGIAGEEAVVCRDCETHHHAECWEEFGGCTVYGCGSTRSRALGASGAAGAAGAAAASLPAGSAG